MTVKLVKKPVEPVKLEIKYVEQPKKEVHVLNIKYVEQPKQEPVTLNIKYPEKKPVKVRVFKGYDDKGRPVFVDKDEPEANE